MLRNLILCIHTLCLQIYYYADNIYRTAGVLENDIQYVTVATGSVNVFMTIAAVSPNWVLPNDCSLPEVNTV